MLCKLTFFIESTVAFWTAKGFLSYVDHFMLCQFAFFYLTCCHILNSWKVSPLCGYAHAQPVRFFDLWGFAHVQPVHFFYRKYGHTLNSWKVFPLCGFTHVQQLFSGSDSSLFWLKVLSHWKQLKGFSFTSQLWQSVTLSFRTIFSPLCWSHFWHFSNIHLDFCFPPFASQLLSCPPF